MWHETEEKDVRSSGSDQVQHCAHVASICPDWLPCLTWPPILLSRTNTGHPNDCWSDFKPENNSKGLFWPPHPIWGAELWISLATLRACCWERSFEGDSLTHRLHWEWQCHVWSHHYIWLATWWSLSWWESMRHPVPSGGASYWPSWGGDEVSFVIRDVIRQTVLNPDCSGISVKPCHFIFPSCAFLKARDHLAFVDACWCLELWELSSKCIANPWLKQTQKQWRVCLPSLVFKNWFEEEGTHIGSSGQWHAWNGRGSWPMMPTLSATSNWESMAQLTHSSKT